MTFRASKKKMNLEDFQMQKRLPYSLEYNIHIVSVCESGKFSQNPTVVYSEVIFLIILSKIVVDIS